MRAVSEQATLALDRSSDGRVQRRRAASIQHVLHRGIPKMRWSHDMQAHSVLLHRAARAWGAWALSILQPAAIPTLTSLTDLAQ